MNSATIDVIGAGTLNGVTLTTPMTIDNGGLIESFNGLTLNSTITLFNTGDSPVLIDVGTQTIGGTGTILFGGTSGSGSNFVEPNIAAPLTLGPNITIRTTTEGGTVGSTTQTTTNQGTISAQTSGFTITIAAGLSPIPARSRRATAEPSWSLSRPIYQPFVSHFDRRALGCLCRLDDQLWNFDDHHQCR